MKSVIFSFLLLCIASVEAQTQEKVALWTYDSAISADVFLMSQELQAHQIRLLFESEAFTKAVGPQSERLFKESKALMVKAYGCGANSSTRAANSCQVDFTLYDLTAQPTNGPSPIYAQLTATVNTNNGQVSHLQFDVVTKKAKTKRK